jgi:hypothetical protein
MADYQLTASDDTVIRTADQAFIPNDPANRDWIDYQAWLAAGGVPDPYVPPPEPPPRPAELAMFSDQYAAAAGVLTQPPGMGLVCWDADNPAQASKVMIYGTDQNQSNMMSQLAVALQPGRVLRIEDRTQGGAKFVGHTIVTATAVDADRSFDVEVTPLNDAAMPFTTNTKVTIGVYIPGSGTGPAASITAPKEVRVK